MDACLTYVAAEPNKSQLAERPDPVPVPDLEAGQAAGRESAHHEQEPNTSTLYWHILDMNQVLKENVTHVKGCCRISPC